MVDIDGRDPERAPIQWRRPSSSGPGAGFTTGEPWLPLVAEAERLSVEAQLHEPNSTLKFARRMLRLRARLPALRAGSQRIIEAAPDAFCFVRELDDRFLVAVNFSSEPLPLDLREQIGERGVLELSTDPDRTAGPFELDAILLAADEGVIVRLL